MVGNRIFIIGVMKGGTTVLHENLCKHSKIFPGRVKELHYYSLHYHKGKKWYEDQFPRIEDDEYTVDASPTYFSEASGKLLPQLIKNDYPDAKIIIIFRDPVSRSISHFNHFRVVNKTEALLDIDVNDFFDIDFIKSVAPTESLHWFLFRILRTSNYYWHFLNYKQVFDRENILLLTNEELKNTPQVTMEKVFHFLNLDPIQLDLFSEVRHSHKPEKLIVTDQTRKKLKRYLYPNYRLLVEKEKLNAVLEDPDADVEVMRKDVVTKGKDGWLFLTGGSNALIDQYSELHKIERAKIIENCDLLETRYAKMKAMGIDYYSIIVPNKLSVYNNYFLDGLDYNVHLLKRVKSKLIGRPYFVNLLDPFIKHRNEFKIFWKTDSHWSPYGCYFAYQMLCNKIGIEAVNLLQDREFEDASNIHDLGGKFTPPVHEWTRHYSFIRDSKRVYRNKLVEFKEENNLENDLGLHAGSHIVFENPQAKCRKKVVLFGDSFSEYRTHLLTGILAETFGELHFIWNLSVDYHYLEEVKPDIVITECVERFLVKCPVDTLEIKSFADDRIKAYKDRSAV